MAALTRSTLGCSNATSPQLIGPFQFPVQDQPVSLFGQQQRVAELHFGIGFVSDNDMDVRLLQRKDLLFVFNFSSTDDPLMGLSNGLRQLLHYALEPERNVFHLSFP